MYSRVKSRGEHLFCMHARAPITQQFHKPLNSVSVKLSSAHACMSKHAHAHSALAVTLSRPGAPERRPRRCRRRAQRGCRLPHAHRAMATSPTCGTTRWILAENRRGADPDMVSHRVIFIKAFVLSLAISLPSPTTRCYLRGILAPQSCGNRWVMSTGRGYPFKPGGFVHHALL